MASNQTSNYGLNQWAATDKVLREEFNQDNAKIDGALAAIQSAVTQEAAQRQQAVEAVAATVPKIVTGTYAGDGAASRFIDLGATPKAVYVCQDSGKTFSSVGWTYWGGLAFPDFPNKVDSYTVLSIEENGFRVYYNTSGQMICSNMANEFFHYAALM